MGSMTKLEKELGKCLVMLANKDHIIGWDKWLIGETYENDHCKEVYRLIMKLQEAEEKDTISNFWNYGII